MAVEVELAQRFRVEFTQAVRSRGAAYARQGRVRVESVRKGSARCVVRGSAGSRYRVHFATCQHDPEDLPNEPEELLRLDCACSCPHFERGYPCKHLYAALLTLDAQGQSGPLLGSLHAGKFFGVLHPMDLIPETWNDDARDTAFERSSTSSRARSSLLAARARVEAARDADSRRRHTHRSPKTGRLSPAPTLDEGWLGAAGSSSPPGMAPRIEYQILQESAAHGQLEVELLEAARPGAGSPSARKLRLQLDQVEASLSEADVRALRALDGCRLVSFVPAYAPSPYMHANALHQVVVPEEMTHPILELLADTGRLRWGPDSDSVFVAWRRDAPVSAHIVVESGARVGSARVRIELRDAQGDSIPVESVGGVLDGDVVVVASELRPLTPSGSALLLRRYLDEGAVEVARRQIPALMQRLASLNLPPLESADELGWVQELGTPTGYLQILRPGGSTPATRVWADLLFLYEDLPVQCRSGARALIDADSQTWIRRDPERESELLDQLVELGGRPLARADTHEADIQLSRKQLPEVVRSLLERGWRIDLEGHRVKRATGQRFEVRSGVDWFDVEAGIDFGDGELLSHELFGASPLGRSFVRLPSGDHGMIPEVWLDRMLGLSDLADSVDGSVLRFRPQQALLLDAMLRDLPEVETDAEFRRLCRRLTRAGSPQPRKQPRGFRGELRPYQREGLGWMHHLRQLGIGGCLADDMGLGKTVQVLALLQSLRVRGSRGEEARPSLIVVPKSLVHNWLCEAERFAPKLRALDFTGSQRGELRERLAEFDLIVTTYGILRRDVAKLAETRFDYAILDEATAIKNAASQSWKAARLIRADHRLALSGTPIENHLGDLWSLFEFLNPGMLGHTTRSHQTFIDDGNARAALRHALEPFLLRRTKQQVLPQLPEKTEQTLYCELRGKQRRRYDELLRQTRTRLLARVENQGLARSRMHVLEALLRLRQVACHPGLVDPGQRRSDSAKLELLLPALEQATEEGHKVLVFSQFTTLLAIVRERLDQLGVRYTYLDGKTRRRADRVREFQQDPDCRVFLISLKAGGHGLNLTAADYVFLLDPWWNPAVEAQAIDRAHRIGQQRSVLAYRLVAENTIEEKILELQRSKLELANGIVSADRGALRGLTVEDLETLLG